MSMASGMSVLPLHSNLLLNVNLSCNVRYPMNTKTSNYVGVIQCERFLRAGKYTGWGPLLFCGAEVHGSTLGLIGAGRIGKIMAQRASGFAMKVIYYDVYRMSAEDEAKHHM